MVVGNSEPENPDRDQHQEGVPPVKKCSETIGVGMSNIDLYRKERSRIYEYMQKGNW